MATPQKTPERPELCCGAKATIKPGSVIHAAGFYISNRQGQLSHHLPSGLHHALPRKGGLKKPIVGAAVIPRSGKPKCT